MSAARAFVLDFTGSGNFNSFTQSLMGFLFRHSANSFKKTYLKQSKKYKAGSLRYLQQSVNAISSKFSKKSELAHVFLP
jgi:hypothetical protein